MRSQSEPSERGATLLEILIVLAILASVSAIASATVLRPNERLEINRMATSLQDEAATQRARALTRGEQIVWRPIISSAVRVDNCEGARPEIRFTPKGAALGDEICLARGEFSQRLSPDWLTGGLRKIDP